MQRALQRGVTANLKSAFVCLHNEPLVVYQCTRRAASVAEVAEEPSSSGRGPSQSAYWLGLPAAAAAAYLGTAYAQQEQALWTTREEPLVHTNCLGVPWVQQLAAQGGNKVVLSAETMQNHPLLKKDHMFAELHRHEMVEDLVCFYNAPERSLKYVIQLGKNVCGFPKIMHGGLTAAIIDESFGFLWLSLRSNKQLPFRGPAFTAHLEVNYKQKIPAGRLLLCTTEVESCEGRKLWMKATVCDGPTGKVYATARALFVCPKTQKLIHEGVKYAYTSLFAQ